MSLEMYQANKALIIKLDRIQHFAGNYLADLEEEQVKEQERK